MGKPTDTIITLTVNTASITQAEKNKYVTFSDNQGDPAETPGKPGIYESTVNKNAKVTWVGVSENKTDTVCITDVSQKLQGGGETILKAKVGPPVACQITWQVVNNQVVGDEYYNVTFTINGDNANPYTIDPKLRMN